MDYGYSRCSTNETKQDINRQVRELKSAGAEEIFLEYEHGDSRVKPQQAQMFYECMEGIEAKGGGDIPEDGLEALGYAIRSDWTREGVKKRHIIVVWSDAPTHELGHGKVAPWYPEGMAEEFDELSLWWEDEQLGGGMDENAKRLLIFAPDAPDWSRISSEWGQVIHVQTVSEGLLDVEYRQVLDAVCNTI